ncbi:MAG TPA: hypothetical protein VKB78_07835, partial [Pirellulales bacterium]|nr:hypothetical protein [Pirellulales bacterium]
MSRQPERTQNLTSRGHSSRAAWRRASPVGALLLAAIFLIPTLVRGQTLTWDPFNSGPTGSDNSGVWDFTVINWYNSGTLSDTPWVNGADAVIGAGGVVSAGTQITLDAGSPVVLNSLTFNALDPSSTSGYTIVDSSGTGSSPLGVGASNSLAITNNAAGVTTTINANIVSNGSNPFMMNILGTGALNISGSIGVTSGTNTGAGTLRVGSSPGTGYSGTLTLGAANNLSAITVNSGTVAASNAASLGSGPLTLSGGTMSFSIPGIQSGNPIVMHVAAAANTTTAHNTMTASMSAAGVVSVAAGNWNNLQIARGTTPEKGYPGNASITATNQQSTLPLTLKDSTGTATAAQV